MRLVEPEIPVPPIIGQIRQAEIDRIAERIMLAKISTMKERGEEADDNAIRESYELAEKIYDQKVAREKQRSQDDNAPVWPRPSYECVDHVVSLWAIVSVVTVAIGLAVAAAGLVMVCA